MGPRRCEACEPDPVMRCGRCTDTRCAAHALEPGSRCERCERDWAEEAPTRRAAKLIFVPPLALFVGGMLFALLPLGSAIGAAVMCALACSASVGVGAG